MKLNNSVDKGVLLFTQIGNYFGEAISLTRNSITITSLEYMLAKKTSAVTRNGDKVPDYVLGYSLYPKKVSTVIE